jgi:hypothetical protein
MSSVLVIYPRPSRAGNKGWVTVQYPRRVDKHYSLNFSIKLKSTNKNLSFPTYYFCFL